MGMKSRKMVFEGKEYEQSTPMRAIRAKCIDCSGGVSKEVRRCPCAECPLYPFRMGKNPFSGALRQQTKEGIEDCELMEF